MRHPAVPRRALLTGVHAGMGKEGQYFFRATNQESIIAFIPEGADKVARREGH